MLVGMSEECKITYYKAKACEEVGFEQNGKTYKSKYGVKLDFLNGGIYECSLFVDINDSLSNIVKFNVFDKKELIGMMEKEVNGIEIMSTEHFYTIAAKIIESDILGGNNNDTLEVGYGRREENLEGRIEQIMEENNCDTVMVKLENMGGNKRRLAIMPIT